jgi:hypothetical protein
MTAIINNVPLSIYKQSQSQLSKAFKNKLSISNCIINHFFKVFLRLQVIQKFKKSCELFSEKKGLNADTRVNAVLTTHHIIDGFRRKRQTDARDAASAATAFHESVWLFLLKALTYIASNANRDTPCILRI